jgi:chaperonin cofactor prefoldin
VAAYHQSQTKEKTMCSDEVQDPTLADVAESLDYLTAALDRERTDNRTRFDEICHKLQQLQDRARADRDASPDLEAFMTLETKVDHHATRLDDIETTLQLHSDSSPDLVRKPHKTT